MLEVQAALERAFDQIEGAWQHPGIWHLYIHIMEMSPTPEKALRMGDPENVCSLHGFYECLERLGKVEEAALIKPRLDLANARADAPIKASCACRLTHSSCC